MATNTTNLMPVKPYILTPHDIASITLDQGGPDHSDIVQANWLLLFVSTVHHSSAVL